jgi:hypothetical protein
MGEREKAVADAYAKGYRRGRVEATAEARKLYSGRIRDALAILQAPVPAEEKETSHA